jgi:hypothetical protein
MDLKKWMAAEKCVHGKRGRISIKEDGVKKIYSFIAFKYANSYTIDEYGLEKALEMYKQYLVTSELINEIEELRISAVGVLLFLVLLLLIKKLLRNNVTLEYWLIY